MFNAMRNITVWMFEHLEITYKLDVDQRVKYTNRILKGPAIKNILHNFWIERIQLSIFPWNQWTFGIAKEISMEKFWVWYKSDGLDAEVYPIIGEDQCEDFEK